MVFVGDTSIVFMGFIRQFITFGGTTVGDASQVHQPGDIPHDTWVNHHV